MPISEILLLLAWKKTRSVFISFHIADGSLSEGPSVSMYITSSAAESLLLKPVIILGLKEKWSNYSAPI
jgi:hypothetical protein